MDDLKLSLGWGKSGSRNLTLLHIYCYDNPKYPVGGPIGMHRCWRCSDEDMTGDITLKTLALTHCANDNALLHLDISPLTEGIFIINLK